jgi:hypothetical protein
VQKVLTGYSRAISDRPYFEGFNPGGEIDIEDVRFADITSKMHAGIIVG